MIDTYDYIEGSDCARALEREHSRGLSGIEADYINECVEGGDPSALVDRIDELGSSEPPKAIDSNPEIAELIAPVKDQIDPIYLEAPSDSEQVEQASEALLDIKGAHYVDWEIMTPAERLGAMQEVENQMAAISHRPPCEVTCREMGDTHFGYYDKTTGTITLNSRYLDSDIVSYRETLDTIIHEGRHAYQDYNLTCRQVHTSPGDLTNWHINENKYGYQSAEVFGSKLYWMQPVEADARKFAEDVYKKFTDKA